MEKIFRRSNNKQSQSSVIGTQDKCNLGVRQIDSYLPSRFPIVRHRFDTPPSSSRGSRVSGPIYSQTRCVHHRRSICFNSYWETGYAGGWPVRVDIISASVTSDPSPNVPQGYILFFPYLWKEAQRHSASHNVSEYLIAKRSYFTLKVYRFLTVERPELSK